MKAQRSAQNRIVLFRPTENAARMRNGAERLSMVPPPSDLFVGAVQQLVRDNQDYVPPQVLLHPRPTCHKCWAAVEHISCVAAEAQQVSGMPHPNLERHTEGLVLSPEAMWQTPCSLLIQDHLAIAECR